MTRKFLLICCSGLLTILLLQIICLFLVTAISPMLSINYACAGTTFFLHNLYKLPLLLPPPPRASGVGQPLFLEVLLLRPRNSATCHAMIPRLLHSLTRPSLMLDYLPSLLLKTPRVNYISLEHQVCRHGCTRTPAPIILSN